MSEEQKKQLSQSFLSFKDKVEEAGNELSIASFACKDEEKSSFKGGEDFAIQHILARMGRLFEGANAAIIQNIDFEETNIVGQMGKAAEDIHDYTRGDFGKSFESVAPDMINFKHVVTKAIECYRKEMGIAASHEVVGSNEGNCLEAVK